MNTIEIMVAEQVSAQHIVIYSNQVACDEESKMQLLAIIQNHISNMTCIINNTCEVTSLEITGCPAGGNSFVKRSVEQMSFRLVLSLAGLSDLQTVPSLYIFI